MKKNLLIDSSGYVLKLLQKILDTNIEIQGLENIPKDNPRIFVANHFTRMEALVVPYWVLLQMIQFLSVFLGIF